VDIQLGSSETNTGNNWKQGEVVEPAGLQWNLLEDSGPTRS